MVSVVLPADVNRFPPAPLVQEPTTMDTEPEAPLVAAPVPRNKLPVLENVAAPVCTCTAPDVAVVADVACTAMFPLPELDPPSPDCTYTDPPVWVLSPVLPDDSNRLPAAVFATPTRSEMGPADPPVAAPVRMLMLPDPPLVDAPVATVTDPEPATEGPDPITTRPDPVYAVPVTTEMAPDPPKLVPVVTAMSPLVPDAPELNSSVPVAPVAVAPTFADTMYTEPLVVEALAPLRIANAPPVPAALVLGPADMNITPPTPELVEPVTMEMAPAAPPVAAPVVMDTCPTVPALLAPTENTMYPLVPPDREEPVRMYVLPVVAVASPDVTNIAPVPPEMALPTMRDIAPVPPGPVVPVLNSKLPEELPATYAFPDTIVTAPEGPELAEPLRICRAPPVDVDVVPPAWICRPPPAPEFVEPIVMDMAPDAPVVLAATVPVLSVTPPTPVTPDCAAPL